MYLTGRTPEKPLLYPVPSSIIQTQMVAVLPVSDKAALIAQGAAAIRALKENPTPEQITTALIKSFNLIPHPPKAIRRSLPINDRHPARPVPA